MCSPKLWLAALEIEPNEPMLAVPDDHQYGDLLADRNLAARWRRFHHKCADIRIVSKRTHQKLPQNRRREDNRQLSFFISEGRQEMIDASDSRRLVPPDALSQARRLVARCR
jgi:hypothetical protein